MLTQEQVMTAVRSGRDSQCLDGRDYARLAPFFPVSDIEAFGLVLKEGAAWEPKPWTREAVMACLEKDLAFAFEKALNRRGISAGLMREVIQMWLWVLDEGLPPEADDDDYAQYGLPLLKAVAIKFGLPNEIGDDRGDEHRYSSDAA